jgi:hypothetical protein
MSAARNPTAPAATRLSLTRARAPCHTRSETATRSGTLIGQDAFGNKYYENRAYQIGAPCAQRSAITTTHAHTQRANAAGSGTAPARALLRLPLT